VAHRAQRRRIITPGPPALLGLAVVVFLFGLDRTAPSSTSPPDSHDAQGLPYPQVPHIPLAEAKARYDAGTALFVDVRSRGEYETTHIPDATWLPLTDLDTRYQELPREAEIITCYP
jgi:3-mercaptopyruvate sulfurtransferase SseA